jgi:hypothetical protein
MGSPDAARCVTLLGGVTFQKGDVLFSLKGD